MRNNFLIAQRAAIITVVVGIGAAFVGNVLLNLGGGSNQVAGAAVRSLGLTTANIGLIAFLISNVWKRSAERAPKQRKRVPSVPPRRSTAMTHLPFHSSGIAAARIVAMMLFVLAGLSLLGVFWTLVSFGAGMGFGRFGPGMGLSLIGMLHSPAVFCTLGLVLWLVADLTQHIAAVVANGFEPSVSETNETVMASVVDPPRSASAKDHGASSLFTEKET